MRTLLTLLFAFLISLPVLGQEKYFHDLKGIEDSSGTTHLFYRLYNHMDEDYDIGSESCIIWRNDVFHFDTQAEDDSLKFESLRQYRCQEFDTPISAIQDFDFLNNDPNKWFTMSFVYGIYQNYFGAIRAYNGSYYDALGTWGNKLEMVHSDTLTYGVFDFWKGSIVNILKGDSLPSETYPRGLLVKAPKDTDEFEKDCPNGEEGMCFYGKSDSLFIYGQSFLSIDQNRKNNLYFQRNDSLFWSDDLGKTMTFLDDTFNWSSMDVFLFGSEDSTLIAASRFKYSPLWAYFNNEYGLNEVDRYQLLRSNNLGETWEEIRVDSSKLYISQLLDENGTFYTGNKNSLYQATNYGESFSVLLEFNHPITGLYKKPDSDILYVLTTEELLEVNTETKTTTSLKNLPVSNESDPNDIPNQVTLNQNYPNPFNPSTVISYQVAGNSLVRLEVFDVTGRKVAVLVDGERKPIGNHQVRFDGTGLSTGVYFYRLETAGQTLTRKMLLVK